MKNSFSNDLLYDSEGRESGYISEDFGIWVPPKRIDDAGISCSFESVLLEGSGENADIVFYVPKDRAFKEYVGGSTKLRDNGWTKKNNTSALLAEFVALADAEKSRYLKFAQEWGPLWERESKDIPVIINLIPDNCSVAPWIEPIRLWRRYACKAKSLIRIAESLGRGEIAPLELWQELDPDFMGSDNLAEQRFMYQFYFNMEIYQEYDVRYSLVWTEGYPEIKVQSRLGFLSALWFQFMQAVSRQTFALCSGCGKTYVREGRKPKRGMRNYCDECRDDNYKASKKEWYHKPENKAKVKEQRRLKKLKDI